MAVSLPTSALRQVAHGCVHTMSCSRSHRCSASRIALTRSKYAFHSLCPSTGAAEASMRRTFAHLGTQQCFGDMVLTFGSVMLPVNY